MNNKWFLPGFFWITFLSMGSLQLIAQHTSTTLHVWEMKEITFKAGKNYKNYYEEVSCWVELTGPGFAKRIYGFWDGGDTFKVRVVATQPGKWKWNSGSNQLDDKGLNNQTGIFTALAWTDKEKIENPNRRGFVHATPNGHALQYADGSPFFMVGDTWLAGSTWRLPFRNAPTSGSYLPGPGIGFEDAIQYHKNQGFNSVSMISSFPNWEADLNPSTYADENGIFLRNAWEKFGYDVAKGKGTDASGGISYWGSFTAKNMRDESGNLPFALSENPGLSDFDRINPAYFQSLDKKMQYMSAQGFVPLLETIRRDAGPSWNAYFTFNESFARYVQYIISRYGAQNFVFSGIHLDWIPRDFSLTSKQFNEALTYHLKTYGPPPFGQIHTSLIDHSTYITFGHGEEVPWLNMHSVGNKPRDHGFYGPMDTLFNLQPAYPAINFEPYYTGWNHEINKPGGETPPPNSDRDNYFARAQMYGSVLSGGLSGHVHGTAAYDITSTGEPAGARPHIWDALRYQSGAQMQYLKTFVLSEGGRYQYLQPCHQHLHPQKSEPSSVRGLDGWSLMMCTPEKDFALIYFENKAVLPELSGFKPNTTYTFKWYDPKTGQWGQSSTVTANGKGTFMTPTFPDGKNPAATDWAAKILEKQ